MEVMAFSHLCVPVLQLPLLDGARWTLHRISVRGLLTANGEKIFSKAVTFLIQVCKNCEKKSP